MTSWMVCTTCSRTVLVNETGTCLRCIRGFGTEMAEDDYLYVDQVQKLKEEEIIEKFPDAKDIMRRADACTQQECLKEYLLLKKECKIMNKECNIINIGMEKLAKVFDDIQPIKDGESK